MLEYHKLHDFLISKYDSSKTDYLMIEEILICSNFEKVINSKHDKNIYDIYLVLLLDYLGINISLDLLSKVNLKKIKMNIEI